jgi:glucosyl-dolichyl phosphate glucuronosyltransferase
MRDWRVYLSMLTTVAICTFDRAASLRRKLESLVAIRVPKDLLWEVVVVRNNCTDDTDEVVKEFGGRPPIRCEFEAWKVCRMRATALSAFRRHLILLFKLRECPAPYIHWTDGDIIVDAGAAHGSLDTS